MAAHRRARGSLGLSRALPMAVCLSIVLGCSAFSPLAPTLRLSPRGASSPLQRGAGPWARSCGRPMRVMCTAVKVEGEKGEVEPKKGEGAEEQDHPFFVNRTVKKGSLYRRTLKMVAPRTPDLLLRHIVCFALLVLGRVANVMVPLTYKRVVDMLTASAGLALGSAKGAAKLAAYKTAALQIVVVYLTWKAVQSVADIVRQITWVKVQQDVKERTAVRLLDHLLAQSVRFHISSRTGEVMQVIDRGASAIDRLMDMVPFRLVPAGVDVLVASTVLCSLNYPIFGALAGGTVFCYVAVTLVITRWRTKFWRAMVEADQVVKGKAVESLLNFETVKYFAAEGHELDQYRGLIDDWKQKQMRTEQSLALLNGAQQLVVTGGLGCTMLLSAGGVLSQTMSVGDFVMVNTYLLQICLPLSWLGSMYRMVEDAFIDTEKMYNLMDETPEILDTEGAPDIDVPDGGVVFDNVSFSYDGQTEVLRGISFKVPVGNTLAIVGESGGGKSTIARLLFRLYDVSSGSVRIDGQDVRDVTQRSVREAIGVVPQETVLFNEDVEYNISGVVPQETVLFNEDVEYNIRYGSMRNGEPQAGSQEVLAASQAAQLHDKILKFPEGYRTRVGEKGLRLSGGEKQRVGIARTVIKSPKIVLLDEATSALDSQTEAQIQAALAVACEGRTTITIAHRLSTIKNADEIIVLKKGEIVERGRHEELLHKGEVYAAMWARQTTNTTRADASPPAKAAHGQQAHAELRAHSMRDASDADGENVRLKQALKQDP